MSRALASAAIGELGMDLVSSVVHRAGYLVHRFDGTTTGVDALVELGGPEGATGALLALQVKAGKSYWSRDRRWCCLPGNRKWYPYWQHYSLPVVLVVCDIERRCAAWLDVHQHLLQHPELIRDRRCRLSFSATRFLTVDAVRNDFAAIASRLPRPGVPAVRPLYARRARGALDEAYAIAQRLVRSGTREVEDGRSGAAAHFADIELRFDGQITCIDGRGVCTVHRDRRLVGLNLGEYRDLYGQQVFHGLARDGVGYITWVDDFDPDAFDRGEHLECYLKASTGEPTRVNCAVYRLFKPWGWFIIVEVHEKVPE